MKTLSSWACCIFLSALAYQSAHAAPDVKVNVTARVGGVIDPANILGGQIQPGDLISGYYSYDSTVQGWQQAPNANSYQLWGSMFHARLAYGPILFETSPANSFTTIDTMANDAGTGGADGLTMLAGGNLPLSNGASVDNILIRFYDSWGSAQMTPALPTTVPPFPNFTESTIEIWGQQNSTFYSITMRIESTTLEPPQILEVSPAKGSFLPQQRFDAALLLPAGSSIVSAQASAHGTVLALNYPGTCSLLPPNSAGRPALYCPDAHTALSTVPTATHVEWSVELSNGTVLHQSAEWSLAQ